MIQTLIGQKMTQMQNFRQDGQRIPVTEIFVADNTVLQVKTLEKDLYSAAQIGTGLKKKSTKSRAGLAKKAGLDSAVLKIKEVTLNKDEETPNEGDTLTVDAVFKPGDIVTVTGTSKGKGFAGVVRRYNFRGGPKTHGQSDRHRAPGSIGQTTTPGRVYKGKRMGGRMGSDTVTVKNLKVVDVDSENKKLYIAGLVPGHRHSWLFITKTGEDTKFVPLIGDKKEEVVEEVKIEEALEVVKDATETVETPEEVVETAAETVETPSETVETPADEVKSEETAEDVVEVEQKEEKEKAEVAENADAAVKEVKEENA